TLGSPSGALVALISQVIFADLLEELPPAYSEPFGGLGAIAAAQTQCTRNRSAFDGRKHGSQWNIRRRRIDFSATDARLLGIEMLGCDDTSARNNGRASEYVF